jgi:hypothetical protein
MVLRSAEGISMKATVKRKGGKSTRVKSAKEGRRDVKKGAKAAVKKTASLKPKSGKSKIVEAAKTVVADAAMAGAVAVGKSLVDAAQTALKPLAESQEQTAKKADAKKNPA